MYWWRWPGWPLPDEWTAWWTFMLVLVSAAAAIIAYVQYRSARAPYVVVYLRPEPENISWAQLIMVNYGRTVAFAVRLRFDPPFLRAWYQSDEPTDTLGETALLTRGLVALPPNEPYAFRLDVYRQRKVSDQPLPSRFDVSVIYRDRWNRQHVERYVIDFNEDDGIDPRRPTLRPNF
jgi:hypothetical protein